MDFFSELQPDANEQAKSDVAASQSRLDRLSGQLPDWLIDRARHLLVHARFEAAMTLYAETVLKNFRRLPFLARITSGEARYLICTALIAYHYTSNPQILETSATVGRLQDIARCFRIASPNRVVALLALLKYVGAVETFRSPVDRRTKLVDFTPPAVAHADKVGLGTLRPVQMLSEQHDYVQAWDADPGFRGRYYSECLRLYQGARFVPTLPELYMLSTQDGAGELKFMLWLALVRRAPSAPPVFDFPYGRVAKELGVSRAHVRRIFENCQENGLLILHKSGGQGVELLPAYSESLKAYSSLEMALTMQAADFAARETATPGSMAWLKD
jgi:hypothetical protein